MADGFKQAAAITKKYARSFYFSSYFLSKEKRNAAYAVYALCRISDEAVDGAQGPNQAERLLKIKNDIDAAYSGVKLDNGVLSAFRETVDKYAIPKEYFGQLLSGMQMDLDKTRYRNFSELCDYCYKVAGVVGLVMLKIFGYKDRGAEKYAVNLGIAMQLTNILRDIKEDFQKQRLYLPEDEMRRYGLTEENIASGKIDDKFTDFLKFKIQQARSYYNNAEPGIKLVTDRRSRFSVYAMKEIYAKILDDIEKNRYDIFSRRAHTSTMQKLCIALRILIKGGI